MASTTSENLTGLDSTVVQRVQSIWQRFNLGLDIPAIDRQHVWLIALVVRLETMLENASEPGEAFGITLTEAMDYSVEHFELEEKLLEKAEFPGLPGHKRQHARFIAALRLRARDSMKGDPQAAEKLLKTLKHWLFNHILTEDRAYVEFVTKKGENAQKICEELGPTIREEQEQLYILVTHTDTIEDDADQVVIDAVSAIWHKYRLRIGIPIIDMQHLWLIRQVVELDALIRQKHGVHVAPEILIDRFNHTIMNAVVYVKEHFSTEEALLRRFNFPGYANHIRQHKYFIDFVNRHNEENKSGDLNAARRLLQDLKEWLISHIAVEDKKLYFFLHNRMDEVNEYISSALKAGHTRVHRGYLQLYKAIVQYEMG